MLNSRPNISLAVSMRIFARNCTQKFMEKIYNKGLFARSPSFPGSSVTLVLVLRFISVSLLLLCLQAPERTRTGCPGFSRATPYRVVLTEVLGLSFPLISAEKTRQPRGTFSFCLAQEQHVLYFFQQSHIRWENRELMYENRQKRYQS